MTTDKLPIRLPPLKRSTWFVTAVGLLAALGSAAAFAVVSPGADTLTSRLKVSFPNTRITSVECGRYISGLCEVIAGRNVFYASHDGRFVVVGSLLDLSKKIDVTDERLRKLAALDGATARIDPGAAQREPQPKVPATRITVNLPADNAIVHHPGASIKVKVFSDFSCGYCRALFAELASDPSVEVSEYPVAMLGEASATKARLVLCSTDRVAASAVAYAGGEIKTAGDCARAAKAVEANTNFAREHGVSGTPTIVRADGAVNQGYLDGPALKAFAGGNT